MDHQVPGGQIRKGIQLLPVGGALFGGGFPPGLGFGNELTLRQHRQLGKGIFQTVGQGSLAQQNLPGLGKPRQGDGEKSGHILVMQQLLHELCPAAGAAEHQGAEFRFLVVGHVADRRVQIAAVGGQLLGGNGQQNAGRAVLRVGGAAEGIKVYRGCAPETPGKILPLAYKIRKLSRHQAAV